MVDLTENIKDLIMYVINESTNNEIFALLWAFMIIMVVIEIVHYFVRRYL